MEIIYTNLDVDADSLVISAGQLFLHKNPSNQPIKERIMVEPDQYPCPIRFEFYSMDNKILELTSDTIERIDCYGFYIFHIDNNSVRTIYQNI